MFSDSVHLYDAIYLGSGLKDYRAEAAALTALIRASRPGAESLLDVACGTGEHAKWLAADGGFRVDGLDVEPGFVRRAAEKVPVGAFHVADMTDFALDAKYDVVTCLFSAIGYVRDATALERALRCMRAHLRPGGLVLVEPWFEPEQWHAGRVYHLSVEVDDGRVCRVSRSDVDGSTSIIEFHYLIASAARIEHRVELHRLRLFTRAEMLAAFVAAGLAAKYLEPGISGRGLYFAEASA